MGNDGVSVCNANVCVFDTLYCVHVFIIKLNEIMSTENLLCDES